MLRRVLHNLVARPAVYDLVQALAGASVVRKHLAALVPPLPAGAIVLDIGAGTGLYRSIWPASVRYICLDLDPLKLAGFRARHPHDAVVRADASALPIATGSVDAVACTLMAHHLPDAVLLRMLEEARRVLKPGGVFLFTDPVWRAAGLAGRILWKYDRGRFPREAEVLRSHIEQRLEVRKWDQFALWHHYVACVAIKP
jgi:SAM-dependent methyltransferase